MSWFTLANDDEEMLRAQGPQDAGCYRLSVCPAGQPWLSWAFQTRADAEKFLADLRKAWGLDEAP